MATFQAYICIDVPIDDSQIEKERRNICFPKMNCATTSCEQIILMFGSVLLNCLLAVNNTGTKGFHRI